MRKLLACIVLLSLPACVGPRKIEKPVYYKFDAKKGAKVLVAISPGTVNITAEGPVTIETAGEGLYESQYETADPE